MPSLPSLGTKPWKQALEDWLLVGHNTDGTNKGGATPGTLAARPAASTANGSFYYATDQDVLYLSNGTTWLRIGLPAGATTMVYSNTVPTGWIAYDGTALPASTGIYADLYAHLGSTTATPDTRGRILVPKGTNADCDVLGDNDGSALANRTPKHNSSLAGAISHTLGVSRTADVGIADNRYAAAYNIKDGGSGYGRDYLSQGGNGVDPTWEALAMGGGAYLTQQPNFGLTGGVNNGNLSVGPGGTRPADMPSFITFSVVIAKL